MLVQIQSEMASIKMKRLESALALKVAIKVITLLNCFPLTFLKRSFGQ